MATSRTGTRAWKQASQTAKTRAQNNGQTHCPHCHQPLAWHTTLQPNSPEADHITPWSHGGSNTQQNLRILCRRCNQKRGRATQASARKTVRQKWRDFQTQSGW